MRSSGRLLRLSFFAFLSLISALSWATGRHATKIIIDRQPVDQVVSQGVKATFSVSAKVQSNAADGKASSASAQPVVFSYQWFKDGRQITGATSASYTTAPAVASDDKSMYLAMVAAGSMTASSRAAKLHVLKSVPPRPVPTGQIPTILQQPADQAVVAPQTANYSVAVSGTAPFKYQWSKNRIAIAGANLASYTTPPTGWSDQGSIFSVLVTN